MTGISRSLSTAMVATWGGSMTGSTDSADRAEGRDGDGRAGQFLAAGLAVVRGIAEAENFAGELPYAHGSALRMTGTMSPSSVWVATPCEPRRHR